MTQGRGNEERALSDLDKRDRESHHARLREAAWQLLASLEARDRNKIKADTDLVEKRLNSLENLEQHKAFAAYYKGGVKSGLPQEVLRWDIRDLVLAIRRGDAEGLILGVDKVKEGLFMETKTKMEVTEDEVMLKVIVVMDCKVRKDFGLAGLLENAPSFIDYKLGGNATGQGSPYQFGDATLYVDIEDFEKDKEEGVGVFAEGESWSAVAHMKSAEEPAVG